MAAFAGMTPPKKINADVMFFFFEEAVLMMELPRRHATPFKPVRTHRCNVHIAWPKTTSS
jgi:hypothetical protein